MNPRSFPNTRGALSEEEPEVVDMSLDPRLSKGSRSEREKPFTYAGL